MNQVNKKIKIRSVSLLPYFVLFIASVLYFSLFGDYITYYQEKNSLFIFSKDYLADHLVQPGSLLIYLGNFLTTFFYYPFAGAIVIGSIITFTTFMVSRISKVLSETNTSTFPVLYSAILFFFNTSYMFPVFNTAGLALQLVFFYLTIRYLNRWIAIILFPILYYISGSFAWIFALLFTVQIIVSSFRREWPKIIILCSLALLTIYVLEEYVLFQTPDSLIKFPFSENISGFQSDLFLAFALFTGLIPLISRVRPDLLRKIIEKKNWMRLIPSVVLLIFLVSISASRFDKRTRQYFYAEKLFVNGQFDQVIDYNKKHPSNNMLTIYLNNIALCETGRLNDQLFSFHQDPEGKTLFLNWEMSGEILRRGAYFYYTIGMINEAHRWAYENMIMKGIRPEDLKMLINTELIDGDLVMASKYISIMRKTLFYKRDAERYSKLLEDSSLIDKDPFLGVKRREKIRHDFFSITDNPYVNIERVLSLDSINRKAYEYSLAFMLLKKDYRGIEGELKNLERQGFQRIPIHIEEAAEAYRILKLGPLPDQGNFKVNPQISARFRQFLQTYQQNGNNLKSAEPALRRQFGNTFWYYAFYR
jgi:hypothetical protein